MSDINKIVEELIENKVLERMLSGFSLHPVFAVDQDLKKDFSQDLLIIILEYKDQDKIIALYNDKRNEFNDFIFKIIRNNVVSVKSKFYRTYGRYNSNKTTLQDWKGGEDNGM